MKTLLGVLTLSAMILIFNSLTFAITLQTPPAGLYEDPLTGRSCAAVNLGDRDVEMTISTCYTRPGSAFPVTCYDEEILLEPGELAGFNNFFRCVFGCVFSLCKFTFQENPDNIKAGILINPPDSPTVFIPAE